jgi:hypothetical protein
MTLVSNNSLYYKKPFDQNSLVYLLLRFIGDLCNDIIILYDDHIWSKFTENAHPYAASMNKKLQFFFKKL